MCNKKKQLNLALNYVFTASFNYQFTHGYKAKITYDPQRLKGNIYSPRISFVLIIA